jgi:ketosteroid isomerase-like protein
MDTREVVEKYYEYVNASKWDDWVELFDQNIVMDEQIAGHLEGKASIKEAANGIQKGYSKFKNYPIEIVDKGEEAMVVSGMDAANASGVPVRAKVANYFVVKGGKITYMANFHDTVPFKPFIDQKLN